MFLMNQPFFTGISVALSLDRFSSVLTESHQKLIFHLGELRHAEIEPDEVPFSEHAAPY